MNSQNTHGKNDNSILCSNPDVIVLSSGSEHLIDKLILAGHNYIDLRGNGKNILSIRHKILLNNLKQRCRIKHTYVKDLIDSGSSGKLPRGFVKVTRRAIKCVILDADNFPRLLSTGHLRNRQLF